MLFLTLAPASATKKKHKMENFLPNQNPATGQPLLVSSDPCGSTWHKKTEPIEIHVYGIFKNIVNKMYNDQQSGATSPLGKLAANVFGTTSGGYGSSSSSTGGVVKKMSSFPGAGGSSFAQGGGGTSSTSVMKPTTSCSKQPPNNSSFFRPTDIIPADESGAIATTADDRAFMTTASYDSTDGRETKPRPTNAVTVRREDHLRGGGTSTMPPGERTSAAAAGHQPTSGIFTGSSAIIEGEHNSATPYYSWGESCTTSSFNMSNRSSTSSSNSYPQGGEGPPSSLFESFFAEGEHQRDDSGTATSNTPGGDLLNASIGTSSSSRGGGINTSNPQIQQKEKPLFGRSESNIEQRFVDQFKQEDELQRSRLTKGTSDKNAAGFHTTSHYQPQPEVLSPTSQIDRDQPSLQRTASRILELHREHQAAVAAARGSVSSKVPGVADQNAVAAPSPTKISTARSWGTVRKTFTTVNNLRKGLAASGTSLLGTARKSTESLLAEAEEEKAKDEKEQERVPFFFSLQKYGVKQVSCGANFFGIITLEMGLVGLFGFNKNYVHGHMGEFLPLEFYVWGADENPSLPPTRKSSKSRTGTTDEDHDAAAGAQGFSRNSLSGPTKNNDSFTYAFQERRFVDPLENPLGKLKSKSEAAVFKPKDFASVVSAATGGNIGNKNKVSSTSSTFLPIGKNANKARSPKTSTSKNYNKGTRSLPQVRAVEIACGSDHTLVLGSDNLLYAHGDPILYGLNTELCGDYLDAIETVLTKRSDMINGAWRSPEHQTLTQFGLLFNCGPVRPRRKQRNELLQERQLVVPSGSSKSSMMRSGPGLIPAGEGRDAAGSSGRAFFSGNTSTGPSNDRSLLLETFDHQREDHDEAQRETQFEYDPGRDTTKPGTRSMFKTVKEEDEEVDLEPNNRDYINSRRREEGEAILTASREDHAGANIRFFRSKHSQHEPFFPSFWDTQEFEFEQIQTMHVKERYSVCATTDGVLYHWGKVPFLCATFEEATLMMFSGNSSSSSGVATATGRDIGQQHRRGGPAHPSSSSHLVSEKNPYRDSASGAFSSTRPSAPNGVDQIACSAFATFVIDKDGMLFAFGDGTYGETSAGASVGGTSSMIYGEPVNFDFREPIADIATGDNHTLVLGANSGEVYAFGSDCYGQCGCGIQNRSRNGLLGERVLKPRKLKFPDALHGFSSVGAASTTSGADGSRSTADGPPVKVPGGATTATAEDVRKASLFSDLSGLDDTRKTEDLDLRASVLSALGTRPTAVSNLGGRLSQAELGIGVEKNEHNVMKMHERGQHGIAASSNKDSAFQLSAGKYHSTLCTENGNLYAWGLERNGPLQPDPFLPLGSAALYNVAGGSGGYNNSGGFFSSDAGPTTPRNVNAAHFGGGGAGANAAEAASVHLPTLEDFHDSTGASAGGPDASVASGVKNSVNRPKLCAHVLHRFVQYSQCGPTYTVVVYGQELETGTANGGEDEQGIAGEGEEMQMPEEDEDYGDEVGVDPNSHSLYRSEMYFSTSSDKDREWRAMNAVPENPRQRMESDERGLESDYPQLVLCSSSWK
ncbi:unnamed protein product [Amoebophrya sp. A120]|nr:unnamed protein product [Amoebophrya sp. A120]|eukprot:GSA120T00010146001.1